jgi:hypothetical protein
MMVGSDRGLLSAYLFSDELTAVDGLAELLALTTDGGRF